MQIKWRVDYAVGNTYKVKYVYAENNKQAIKRAKVKNIIDLTPELPDVMSDEEVKELWDGLEDIPMSPLTEKLDQPYFIFPVGTSKEKIWAWFDKNYSKGVNALIYG
jgi:hypothetical protein